MQAGDAVAERIGRDPEFRALVARRSKFAGRLCAFLVALYFGFILVVAFAPKLLGTPIASGVTTIGIPIGLGLIVIAFILTGIYVRRANSEFDEAVDQIIARAR